MNKAGCRAFYLSNSYKRFFIYPVIIISMFLFSTELLRNGVV